MLASMCGKVKEFGDRIQVYNQIWQGQESYALACHYACKSKFMPASL